MGCDITLHCEVKINGDWHHYSEINLRRNYAMFAKLANVRNSEPNEEGYIKPICEPKGLPEDISFVTKVDFSFWNSDAHSMSFLSTDEIKEFFQWVKSTSDYHPQLTFLNGKSSLFMWEHETFGYIFGCTHSNFSEDNKEHQDLTRDYNIEDMRWVFWFDN